MNVKQLAWLILAAWLAAVLALGASDAFSTPAGTPPIPIALGAMLPLAVFLLSYFFSATFRARVLGADVRILAGLQAWRLGGLWFLALYTYGLLPGLFSWPAGIGDMSVALAAPWMVVALFRDPSTVSSRRFVVWNLLGIFDLALALTLGALGSGLLPSLFGAVTTAPMAKMPLLLIPAFLVPLFIMAHLAALFQARRAA